LKDEVNPLLTSWKRSPRMPMARRGDRLNKAMEQVKSGGTAGDGFGD
jgi:hypothetical protein